MTPPDVHLALEKVRKVRRTEKGEEKEILGGVTWSVLRRGISIIIGPSGGGKSTLIRLINRLEDPTSGRILLSGRNITDIESLILRRRVGLVGQKPFMFPGSVRDNLDMTFHLRGEPPSENPDLYEPVLDQCHLDHKLLTREARSLSIGEQQRVSLARALLGRPELLLLDEPTSALDRPTATSLAATLADLCETSGLTLLMATHDLALAERVADYLAFMENGRILETGRARDLLAEPKSEALTRFLSLPEGRRREGRE